MSEKVVPVLGQVPELKEKKTRQTVTVESLLASIRALDGIVPLNGENEDLRIPGDMVVGYRVDTHGKASVSVTCRSYQTDAPTLKAALQNVVEHLDERAQAERARMTESLDAVLRAHGAKRRKGAL